MGAGEGYGGIGQGRGWCPLTARGMRGFGCSPGLGKRWQTPPCTILLVLSVSAEEKEKENPVCRQSWSLPLYSPRVGASRWTPRSAGTSGSHRLHTAPWGHGFCRLVSGPLVTPKLPLAKNQQSISAARTPTSGTQDPSLLQRWRRVGMVRSRTVPAAVCNAAPGEPAQGLQTSHRRLWGVSKSRRDEVWLQLRGAGEPPGPSRLHLCCSSKRTVPKTPPHERNPRVPHVASASGKGSASACRVSSAASSTTISPGLLPPLRKQRASRPLALLPGKALCLERAAE